MRFKKGPYIIPDMNKFVDELTKGLNEATKKIPVSISEEEVQEVLDSFEKEGLVDVRLNEDGEKQYWPSEKMLQQNAKEVLTKEKKVKKKK